MKRLVHFFYNIAYLIRVISNLFVFLLHLMDAILRAQLSNAAVDEVGSRLCFSHLTEHFFILSIELLQSLLLLPQFGLLLGLYFHLLFFLLHPKQLLQILSVKGLRNIQNVTFLVAIVLERPDGDSLCGAQPDHMLLIREYIGCFDEIAREVPLRRHGEM